MKTSRHAQSNGVYTLLSCCYELGNTLKYLNFDKNISREISEPE